MAQPTNTFDSYDAVGIREDLEDVIYDVSPEETPFYSACAKVKAANTVGDRQNGSETRFMETRTVGKAPRVRDTLSRVKI